jgi:hypothetical protein
MRSDWRAPGAQRPPVARQPNDLRFERYDLIVHEPTGKRYRRYNRFVDAAFSPSSPTRVAARPRPLGAGVTYDIFVKFAAPVFTFDRFNDPKWARPGRTMYEREALRVLPGKTSIPLIVDHDDGREFDTIDWVEGRGSTPPAPSLTRLPG